MNIYNKLYDWQKNLIDMIKNKDSFGLWVCMGLGKTPMALALAELNKSDKVLVITINSKAEEKVTDSGSWLNWASKSSIPYKFKNKKDVEFDKDSPELLIVNYESLFERGDNKKEKIVLKPNINEFIKSCRYHRVTIIVDESHKMKNLQSLRTGAIFKIRDNIKRIANKLNVYLLTGTPFTSGYEDTYTQLKLLGCEMTKGNFLENFCIRGNLRGLLGWQQPIIGYKNLDQLFKLIHNYAITIKSEDVLKNLPEQIFIEHEIPQSLEFQSFVSEKMKSDKIVEMCNRRGITPEKEYLVKNIKFNNPFYRNIDYPDFEYLAETPGQFWLRARQLSIGFQGNSEKSSWYNKSRLNKLKTFLANNEDNYLLFYNYTPELLEIYSVCEELGYNIDVYCGEMKSLYFYNRYANSSESEKLSNKKNIILSNFASGSTGMNWQEYHQCIIFSCPIYSEYEQGIKRIHRLGQKENCVYHVFYQDNWLDRGMRKALAEKIDYSTEMFLSDQRRALLEEENEE